MLISLFKAAVYRDAAEAIWPQLLALRAQVSDYVSVIGLQLIIDEAEGYAFLRSRDDADRPELARLVPRRSLSFHVSLLIALLRKKLAESDAAGTDTRLILTRDQIIEMVRVFLPETSNETRLIAGIEANLNKIIDLGFLRRLRGTRGLVRGAPHRQGLRRRSVAGRLRGEAGRLPGPTGQRPGGTRRADGAACSPRSSSSRPIIDRLPGTRLERLEVYNWGTFGGRVWSLDLGGRNTLLTGDIGSGKSTLVDGLTTLLLPATKIAYNKAAGADTKERDLRSYALGFYKAERNETTGVTAPVALRGAGDYSVLLGVFTNRDFDVTVTLAQVFWFKDPQAGQPQRFYLVADGALIDRPRLCRLRLRHRPVAQAAEGRRGRSS